MASSRSACDGPVLAAVAAGGALGSLARYGVGLALPHPAWASLLVNVSGCVLIGALMVVVAGAHRLARPFLGVGVLGGYTTFSAYAVDVVALAGAGRLLLAAAYLVGTVVGALLAVWAGATLARAVLA